MSDDPRRLQHILDYGAELADMLQGFDLDDYLDDRRTQLAVERLLTIIGEASKQLTPETRHQIDQPWREIMRFRDRGIHGDDTLASHRLFAIATEHIPPLRDAVAAHLATRTGP